MTAVRLTKPELDRFAAEGRLRDSSGKRIASPRRVAVPRVPARHSRSGLDLLTGYGTTATGGAWIDLDLALVNEANVREHHQARARRAARERAAARDGLGLVLRMANLHRPMVVTMTRYGRRVMDTDGLSSSLKHVRDGIADAVGIDDGAACWRWVPVQVISRQRPHVRVVIEVGAA